MIHPGRATVIVGGQFGSEAKGVIAAWVATVAGLPKMACTTNAGAQAGHTTILANGTKFVCYHLPTIGVLAGDSTIYLNAGSIIDVDLLRREIVDVARALGREPASIEQRVVIHPNAAVITPECKDVEAGDNGTKHLASTGKGVGAAQANKIMRRPGATIGSARRASAGNVMPGVGRIGVLDLPGSMMKRDTPVTVEIPQGTGLSLNAVEFYPKCTSRDCWVGQGLTDAGIHPIYLKNTLMVCRTFPIRVGHVYDDKGQIVGHSGDFYPGSEELSWSGHFPEVEPERTTVTKRVRRIATWSNVQYEEALRLNCPTHVALTFVNYLPSADALRSRIRHMRRIEEMLGLKVAHVYSWGPRVDQLSYSVDEAAHHVGLRRMEAAE